MLHHLKQAPHANINNSFTILFVLIEPIWCDSQIMECVLGQNTRRLFPTTIQVRLLILYIMDTIYNYGIIFGQTITLEEPYFPNIFIWIPPSRYTRALDFLPIWLTVFIPSRYIRVALYASIYGIHWTFFVSISNINLAQHYTYDLRI